MTKVLTILSMFCLIATCTFNLKTPDLSIEARTEKNDTEIQKNDRTTSHTDDFRSSDNNAKN